MHSTSSNNFHPCIFHVQYSSAALSFAQLILCFLIFQYQEWCTAVQGCTQLQAPHPPASNPPPPGVLVKTYMLQDQPQTGSCDAEPIWHEDAQTLMLMSTTFPLESIVYYCWQLWTASPVNQRMEQFFKSSRADCRLKWSRVRWPTTTAQVSQTALGLDREGEPCALHRRSADTHPTHGPPLPDRRREAVLWAIDLLPPTDMTIIWSDGSAREGPRMAERARSSSCNAVRST